MLRLLYGYVRDRHDDGSGFIAVEVLAAAGKEARGQRLSRGERPTVDEPVRVGSVSGRRRAPRAA